MHNLNNTNVVITGGAGLLGTEHGFAVAAAGGLPVLIDINNERLAAAAAAIRVRLPNARVETRVVDITSRPAVAELRRDLEKSVGMVGCLVNNAAVNTTPVASDNIADQGKKAPGDFETYPAEVWNREIAVCLTGSLFMCQVFGPPMAQAGKGSIVNISSELGIGAPDHRIYQNVETMDEVSVFKAVSYSVVKTGIIGLTRYLATYWGHRGVRCNALVPGGVWNGHDETFTRTLSLKAPLARMATKDDFHDAIVFLCSDGSAYMNGHVLVMDGGRSVW
jgi:NAD(P)-dependent dehydrogenase (short-subunit alcohol dehydrogenase family)